MPKGTKTATLYLKDNGATKDFLCGKLMEFGKVKIVGIGTFSLRTAKSRYSIHPKTREKIFVPEYKKVHFSPSKTLIDFIRQ